MINTKEATAQIEAAFKKAGEAGNEFAKALMELRNINFEVDEDSEEDLKNAFTLGRDIDMRTAYLLRNLLVQHGNVLFL